MRFESFFVGRRSLKCNFGFPVHILFRTKNSLTRIYRIRIGLFSYKISFVTTLSLEFCVFRFVLISWLFLTIYCIRFITIFIWSIWTKWDILLPLHILTNDAGTILSHLIIEWILWSSWRHFVSDFVASLEYLRIIMLLLNLRNLKLNWLLNWQWLIKNLIRCLRLQF